MGVFLWAECVCVRRWAYIYVYMVGVVKACSKGGNVLEGGGEEKLDDYIIFLTLSSLVHEKYYPINLIKMTEIEIKNCKYSK